MKRMILWVGMMVALCTQVRGQGEYHDFTDTQGRSIKAQILACDQKKNTVTIELENKRKATVAISGFSPADQEYIHNWARYDGVRSESKFKISCERNRVDSWNEEILGSITFASGSVEKDQVIGKNSFEKVGFEITLMNRNDGPVDGLVLKYCIFYKQDVNRGGEGQRGVLCGETPISKIDKFAKQVIATDPVVVFKCEYDSSFANSEVLKGEVVGIVIQLSTSEDDGGEVLRTLCFPENILDDYRWVEASIPVGANEAPVDSGAQ